MLVLFTIIVCVASYLMNISVFLLYISYVVGFAILKGFLSDELERCIQHKKS